MCQGRHAQYRIAPVVWTRTEALLRVRTALPGRAGAATGVGGRIATPGDEPDTTTRPPHRNAGHRALKSSCATSSWVRMERRPSGRRAPSVGHVLRHALASANGCDGTTRRETR